MSVSVWYKYLHFVICCYIFIFLYLSAPLSQEKLIALASNEEHANSRRVKDKDIGEMLPETRQLLEDFYKYHNDELGNLLGEQFNYNFY